jgi:hypothetical protein
MRREVSVPRPSDDGGDDPEWAWKYEQRHGASKLKDRELVLQDTLTLLARNGKEVGRIVATLRDIKSMAFENARRGLTLDLQREHFDTADLIRRNLTKWLARAVSLHRESNPDDLPTGRRFRRTYEAMLTALTFDEPMADEGRALRDWLFAPHPKTMPRRRTRQGNPDATLVKDARALLADAGVGRDHHGHLLWAIGVLDENGRLPRRNFSRK